MRGSWRPQAGSCPLDGRVRRLLEDRLHSLSLNAKAGYNTASNPPNGRLALELLDLVLALERRALNLLQAYTTLSATSLDIQCRSICRNSALAASEAGRTARADLSGRVKLASLRPMFVFSSRPVWRSGSARACVVFDAWFGSSHSDGERSLPKTWLTTRELALKAVLDCAGKAA
jgi:hypothetical protein